MLISINLFIPSNLNGSCFDPDMGKLDSERLRKNMTTATEIYIKRVNGAPCGTTNIHLYAGSNSSESLKIRRHVLTYLKGSKIQKEDLKREHPSTYEYIEKVRLKHGIPNVPVQYCFMLKSECCYKKNCLHPFCCSGNPVSLQWFPGVPNVAYIPLSIADPDQPWGAKNCEKCKGNAMAISLTQLKRQDFLLCQSHHQ